MIEFLLFRVVYQWMGGVIIWLFDLITGPIAGKFYPEYTSEFLILQIILSLTIVLLIIAGFAIF